ncbi:MAG: hypothetical protein QOE96_957, partial [Blastocatellia bacterium]|nr:hypothetical protein [Blastocatellia bacterium]
MRSRLWLVVIIITVLAVPALAQKRNITEKDLFNFVWAGDTQISPDGSRVAFVRVTVNEKKDGYNTSIWSVSPANGESHQLTAGPRDSTPRWSPDGKFLVFVRVTEKDGRPDLPQLFMLPMAGGDSFQFTTVTRGAGGPQWSPDGKMIAFGNSANPEDLAKAAKNPQPSPSPTPADAKKPEEPRESDVRVITRAVYRFNGAGYNDPKHPNHLWVVTAPKTSDEKVTPKQLTSGRFSEDGATWAKDSSQIYYASDQIDEPYYELPSTTIYSIPVGGGRPSKLTSFAMDTGAFSVSPNGKQIAFYGSSSQPVQSYTEPDLWVMDIAPNAQPRNLTRDFDYDVGSGVGGDNTAPRGGGGNPPVWTADGRSIVAIYAKEGKANLGRFDAANGKETDLTSGNQAVVSFRATPDASKFALVISSPTRVGDIFWLEGGGGLPKQVTHLNDELFSKLNLTEPEEIWYTSFDG